MTRPLCRDSLCPFAGVDHPRHCDAINMLERSGAPSPLVVVCLNEPAHDGDHLMGDPAGSGEEAFAWKRRLCDKCGCTDASPCLFHVAELEGEIECVWVLFETRCTACVARERGELIGEVRRAPWNRDGEETRN